MNNHRYHVQDKQATHINAHSEDHPTILTPWQQFSKLVLAISPRERFSRVRTTLTQVKIHVVIVIDTVGLVFKPYSAVSELIIT
jgi:hypothetical protein